MLLRAKKFEINISYKYGPTFRQSIFDYNKVLSTLPIDQNDNVFACDCKQKFHKFVYKPHCHVHTGNLNLTENIPLHNTMKMGAKFGETPLCN